LARSRDVLGRVSGFPLFAGHLKFGFDVFIQSGFIADFREEGVFAGREEILHVGRGGDDLLGVDRVEEAFLHSKKDRDLELNGCRAEGGLFEEFDDAGAAFELGLGLGVQVGTELREGGEFTELGELAFEFTADLFGGLDLSGGTDAGNRETDGNGGTDALVEEVGFEEDLAVGDRNHVGRNVRGDVAREGFDNRERGERAFAIETRGALEKTAVEIKHVTRIGFAAGGTLQDERDLAVSDGMLGEIIVNDERIHAVFHEPFADSGAGIGGDILVSRIISSGGRDDDRVLESTGGFESGNGADDVRALLTDGDVDGVNRAELRVSAGEADFVDLGLVDNRIDRDGGLAGATVADDQFALAAADRDHGIDSHDAGEQRLIHGFAGHDAGRDALNRIGFFGVDRAFAIDGVAEGVDDAAKEGFANGNGEQFAGGGDFVAFFELGDVTENDAADFGLFEIKGDADGAAGERDHLVVHDVGEAIDFGHAVGDGADVAGVFLDRFGRELGDLLFDLVEDGAHLR